MPACGMPSFRIRCVATSIVATADLSSPPRIVSRRVPHDAVLRRPVRSRRSAAPCRGARRGRSTFPRRSGRAGRRCFPCPRRSSLPRRPHSRRARDHAVCRGHDRRRRAPHQAGSGSRRVRRRGRERRTRRGDCMGAVTTGPACGVDCGMRLAAVRLPWLLVAGAMFSSATACTYSSLSGDSVTQSPTIETTNSDVEGAGCSYPARGPRARSRSSRTTPSPSWSTLRATPAVRRPATSTES